MKNLTEETLSTERIFSGKVVSLDVQTVKLPNGKTSQREIIRHPGAVAILPVDDEGNIILVRQFRKALDQEILEIPAGKLEFGEDPQECAKRELAEEIGKKANSWQHLMSIWSAPGFTDEKIHIYLAKELADEVASLDEDEFVIVEKYSPEEIRNLVAQGKIEDTKTLLALLACGIIPAYA